jgi:hypothetical protein
MSKSKKKQFGKKGGKLGDKFSSPCVNVAMIIKEKSK